MFIEKEKFNKLREAARGGDDRAVEILKSFRCDDGRCDSLISEYFKPAPTEVPQEAAEIEVMEDNAPDRESMSKLEKYLMDNDVKEGDENYDEYVAEFKQMFPEEETPEPKVKEEKTELDKLIEDEQEAITGYDKYLNELYAAEMCPAKKALVVEKLTKIRDDEIQHIQILKEIEEHMCEEEEKHEPEIIGE